MYLICNILGVPLHCLLVVTQDWLYFAALC